jgi:hypothetical protein
MSFDHWPSLVCEAYTKQQIVSGLCNVEIVPPVVTRKRGHRHFLAASMRVHAIPRFTGSQNVASTLTVGVVDLIDQATQFIVTVEAVVNAHGIKDVTKQPRIAQ